MYWRTGLCCAALAVAGLAGVAAGGAAQETARKAAKQAEKKLGKVAERIKEKASQAAKKVAKKVDEAVSKARSEKDEGAEADASGAAAATDPQAMQEFLRLTSPSEHHEFLKRLEGTWDCTLRVWASGPESAATESKGKMVSKVIMDGRFLLDNFEGEMMGQPFTGLGLTGYDNFKKQYVSTWADSMGTAILTMCGSVSRDGDTLTMYGKMDEPMTGEHEKMVKFVHTFQDADHNTFAIYDLVQGEDAKMFEIDYERAKD